MEKVLKGGPWTFDNHVLALGKMQLGVPLQAISLNHVEFWVQCHNLPVGFMSELVGKHLANYIGEFVDYDPSNNSCVWRAYMRLRVRVDVRQPLKKNRRVRMEGGDWCVVTFKYEKLTTFCFVCGILGHSEQSCEVLFAKAVDDGVREWGVDLRADTRRSGGGAGSRWLRNDNQRGGSPNSAGGGTSNASQARSNIATNQQRNQSHATNLHGVCNEGDTNYGEPIIEERERSSYIQHVVPFNQTSGQPSVGHLVVHHAQAHGPSHNSIVVPLEKKRRREDKQPLVHDSPLHEYTINNNPLAEVSNYDPTGPFYRQALVPRPAKINDCYQLELPRPG